MPKVPSQPSTSARRPHAPKSRAVKLVQLHDALRRQVQHEPADALKSCQRIAPDDALARATRLQLLIALERFSDALAVLGGEDLPHTRPPPTDGQRTAEVPLSAGDPLNHPLETSYCLYKLEHFDRARAVIQRARDAAMDPEALDRGLLLLEAQTLYRLEEYAASRDAYEALLASVDLDSPEQADLETNIAACSSHLDFLASIPARLAEEAVDVAALESTPLVAVLPQPVRRPAAASAVPEPPKLSKTAARRKNRPIKLPPSIAALPESERPAPDPLRWVKKEKVAKRGRSRAQERARVAAATQGGQATAGAATGGTPARRKGGKK